MQAKIIQQTKASTQNAPLSDFGWVLEIEPKESHIYLDKETGWLSNNDTNSQIKLKFKTAEEAKDYAKHHKLEYEIIEVKKKKLVKRAYADNFK